MNNFDIAEQALETSLNSAGSAMAEHEKWQKSLEAQTLKLQASWQSLSQSFMSSDFLKVVLDGVVGLVDGLTELIDTFGAFPTLFGTLAAGMSLFKNGGIFKTFDSDLDTFTSKIGIANKSFLELTQAFKTGSSSGGFKGFINGIKSIGNALTSSFSEADLTAINKYNELINSGIDGQTAYDQAMKHTVSTMGNVSSATQDLIKGANGSTVAIGKQTSATLASRVAMIGARAAAILLNAALTMGISLLVDFAVSGIMKVVNAKDDLAESVDEITSKFKEQHNELKKLKGDYDTSDVSSMISKYEKLSKGVDGAGKNVSLTADEYSEYQSIVNSIADQMPSLVSGYNEQGNAILSCAGNVKQLVAEYERLIHLQNIAVLSGENGESIEKNWKNTASQATSYDFWEKLGNAHSFGVLFGSDNLKMWDMKTSTANVLDNLINAETQNDREKVLEEIDSWAFDYSRRLEIIQALQNEDVDVDSYSNLSDVLEELLKNEPEKIQNALDNYYAQFDDDVAKYKTKATAVLSEAFDVSSALSGLNYGNIGEDLQTIAYQVVNGLDFDFLSSLTEEKGETIEQWTKDMLDQLNSLKKEDNEAIELGFDLQADFNGGDISYGEYVGNLKELGSLIDTLEIKDEFKTQLKISLGLDENGVVAQYDQLIKRLTDTENYDFNVSEEEAANILNGLSSEELPVAVDVIADLSNNNYSETADEILTAFEREMSVRGLSLDLTIDVEKTKIESLATALSESMSGSGLSTESISAIEDMFDNLSSYDPSKLFERTANGIRLNSTELNRLNSEYKDINMTKLHNEMDTLGDIYVQTRRELSNLTYGTEEYNTKAAELSGIESQINELEKLTTSIQGAYSAYQEWQLVESSGSERSMYESVIEGFENVEDEISRGWYDDATVEFIELLSGKDLSTSGIDEIKKAWKGVSQEIGNSGYSVKDFFTVNEDGDSTNTGVYNFLRTVDSVFGGKGITKEDGKIVGFNFELLGGDEAVAEALNTSEEIVQILLRAADDAGFVVTMDGTWQQLDIVREKAQETAVVMNQILESDGKATIDIDMNADSVEEIQPQLDKILETFGKKDGAGNLTGEIDMSIDGAEEALEIAWTLQSMLDRLKRPTYMDIEVNQVEDELQEPLRTMQQIRELTEEKHLLQLSGGDTTELNADLDELYTTLDELPDETKIEVGLVDDNGNPLTGEALIEKVNQIAEGEAELGIKATVDIQLEMDEKLGILVDKALLDAGLITEEEFEKRVNIYLDADADTSGAKEEIDNAINEVVNDSSSGGASDGSGNTPTVEPEVEVVPEPEVKEEGFWSKVWKGIRSFVNNEGNITDENVNGNLTYHIGITPEPEVDSDTKEKVEEEVKESVGDGETIEASTNVEINAETTLSELVQILEDVEKIESKSATIDVQANLEGNIGSVENLENLTTFAEGAKALEGAKSNYVTVSASIEGNVTEKSNLENLTTFATGAKGLNEVSSSYVTVNANLEGNVDELKNVGNITEFAEGAKALNGVASSYVTVSATLDGNIDEAENLGNLTTLADGATKLDAIPNKDLIVKVSAEVDGNIDEVKNLQNLTTLAAGAKELDALSNKNINVTVTANFEGTLKDTENIESLGTFVQAAKDLKDVEDSTVSITADVGGSATNFTADQLSALQTLAIGATELEKIESENITLSISADVNGGALNYTEAQLQNLATLAAGAVSLDELKNKDVSVTVNADLTGELDAGKVGQLETFAAQAKALGELKDKAVDVSVTANLSGEISWSGTFADLSQFAASAQTLQNVSTKEVTVTANIDGTATSDNVGTLSQFASIVNTLQDKNVNINVKASIDAQSIENAISLLTRIADSGLFKDYNATVTATVNYNKGEQTKPEDMSAKVNYELGTQANPIDKTAKVNYELGSQTNPLNKTAFVKYVPLLATGTAHASGSAFARGDWGIKGNGVALGGELGRRYCDHT